MLATRLRSANLDLPLPFSGRLRERWSGLWSLGREDLVLGRLAEGHLDAVAILHELDHPPVPGLLGVWASRSERTGLTATPIDDGWRLDGTLRFCSGAHVLDAALVTAQAPDGYRLFAMSLDTVATTPVEGTWQAVGMADSDSVDIEVSGYAAGGADAIGAAGAYLDRPGFWVGGIGVAAVWAGGAHGLVDAVLDGLRDREPDPHQLAHLGACSADLWVMQAALDAAAREIERAPDGNHVVLAHSVRHILEQACQDVLVRTGRLAGATPLCRDRSYAQRVADLGVYVRQQGAERDLARIGRAVLDEAAR